MKIWLNASAPPEYGGNDCPNPSSTLISGMRLLTEEEVVTLHTSGLLHSPSLYVQACSSERWLICDPMNLGQLAIFDAQAMSLFSLFATPTSISQAVQMVADQPGESIEETILLFYRLGFLQEKARPPFNLHEEASEVLTAWIHISNDCNLRCHYCYIHKNKENMTSDVGYKSIDAVFRSALKHGHKTIRLKYAGGEASLHIARVIELHDYAAQLAQEHSLTLEASLMSNGLVLTQQMIDLLKARHIAVTLSLDGLGDAHDSQRPLLSGKGSSRFVLRTIDRLLANEIVPSITVTVSRHNLAGLPELIRYILAHELPFCVNYYRENEFSQHIDDLNFTDEDIIAAMRLVFELIEEKLPARSLLNSLLDKVEITEAHQRTCEVGQNYLVIDQHGGVAKCQMEIEHTMTTVNAEDPLGIVRRDRKGLQVLRVEEKEGCRTCMWRHWCTGGCAALTYRATGRYDVKSPYCNIYKALFPDVLRLEALRLLCYEEPLVLG